jgi:predicted Rossmann fold flavoprotein
MYYDCIIIGGGASALMLAARLDVKKMPGGGLIIEKTGKCGTKLLMSGGGRCNITHGGSIKDFVSCYGKSGQRLRKCLYRHSNIDLASWLEENGITLADEKGNPVYSRDLEDAGRVFPSSHKSSDILSLFLEKAGSNGWEIRTDAEVRDIRQGAGGWEVKVTPASDLTANNVIIASGGITFPETGSDGSVLRILEDLSISIVSPRSALAPIYADHYPYEELSGISLDDVTVTVFEPGESGSHGKMAARMTGSMLFTHRGFSGPVVLNISRYAGPGSVISIDYGCTFEDLPKRMQRILEKRAQGPSGDVRTTVLTSMLTSDEFAVTSVDENGMVTAGGISLDEIDTSSMQLRRFPGLYAIGEAIDADGITGGYNLQMCWSTASAAADALKNPGEN